MTLFKKGYSGGHPPDGPQSLPILKCPERIQFHFFAPEEDKDKVSYYKLKVLFPHTDLEIVGHEAVEEKVKAAASIGSYPSPSLHEIVPFVIPSLYPSLGRYVYLSPDIIVEGRIDELFEVDLSNYGIAAADDWGLNLSEYVNFDIVDAIQRTGAQPWLSRKAYDKDACGVDLNMLLVDAKKLDTDIFDAILWWSKILNKKNKRTPMNPANVLVLYEKYVKLPHNWKTSDLEDLKTNNETNILHLRGATTSVQDMVTKPDRDQLFWLGIFHQCLTVFWVTESMRHI